MPPSTITTSGTQSPLVSSALSYPQNADPTTYLPYQSPQIILSSGTWRHPKPGFPISVRVTIIGGGGGGGGYSPAGGYSGGGGGAGRINDIAALTVTADVTVVVGAGGTAPANATGGTGGQSSFGAANIATGGSAGSSPNSGPVDGGAGSVGGGGGYRTTDPAIGGNGDIYIGGGGGYGNIATAGTSALRLQTNQLAPTAGPNGVPNGSTGIAIPGLGGLLSQWRPELTAGLYYGDGGNGGAGSIVSTAGKQGAIFIWYNRP